MKFRSGKLIGLLIILLLASAGCQQKLSLLRPPLTDEGELYIYLQPMPKDSDKLQFTVSEVKAVKDDGTETPLNLAFTEIKGADLKSQRLFAYGRLAPGDYVGILMKVDKASIKTEDGEASLLTPEKPVNHRWPLHYFKEGSVPSDRGVRLREIGKPKFQFHPGVHFPAA